MEITPPQVGAFESSKNEGFYLSHKNFLGVLRELNATELVADFIFKLVPGLNGKGISFESSNFPGHYLRHQNYRIKLHQNDNTPIFKLDSTFTVIQGDNNSVRFQGVNYQTYFIRVRTNNELWIDAEDKTARYKEDTTFKFHEFLKL